MVWVLGLNLKGNAHLKVSIYLVMFPLSDVIVQPWHSVTLAMPWRGAHRDILM